MMKLEADSGEPSLLTTYLYPPLVVPAHRIPLITCRTIARCLATKPKGRQTGKQRFTFQLTKLSSQQPLLVLAAKNVSHTPHDLFQLMTS